MQAVSYSPKTNPISLLDERRFSVYNLTLFGVGVNKVKYYVRDESMRYRGSVEVSSYVLDLLRKVVSDKEVALLSDFCSGQNRNINVCTVFLHTTRNVNILTINQ
jgi:hypothetical protein